jgi:nucleoside-diphosphate-sugar epimerase
MPSIALFGAAGAIGQSLAAALRQQGRAYRVVGRSEASLRHAFGTDPLAEIVTWNPDSAASIQAAASGVDTLVYMVGVNYWQFELHPELMRKTLEGAIAAGVRRIVLIGTVYPYGKARSHPVAEDHPREPHTFKGRMRKAQEDLLLQAHAQGRIDSTVLRLAGLFDPMMRELAEMHYLLTDPLILDDSALHGLLGPIAKTPYAQGIRATLHAAMASAGLPLAAA